MLCGRCSGRPVWCTFREYQIAKRYKDIDLIFAVSTPPTQGLLASKVAKKLSKKYKRKVPFIFNLQDVFPDSLVATGLTKKGSLIWKIGSKIEKKTYEGADKIIVISQSIKKNVIDKGVPEQKISVISNWIDTDKVYPIIKDNNRLYSELNIDENKFIVVYAGNFGKAQGAEVVLESASLLSNQKDVQFVIFGGGSEFEKAKEEAKKLDNVIIQGLLPMERSAEVYSLGDVAIITCKKGIGSSGMPSKTWNIMACNTPIIASFDMGSELDEIITEANAGACIRPEDGKALAEAIIDFKNNRVKSNAREYVIKNASKETCVEEYVREMNILSVGK